MIHIFPDASPHSCAFLIWPNPLFFPKSPEILCHILWKPWSLRIKVLYHLNLSSECVLPHCVSAFSWGHCFFSSPLKWWPFPSHIPDTTEPEGWWVSSIPLIAASRLLLFSLPKISLRCMPSHCATQYPPHGRYDHLAQHICWFTACFHAWFTVFVFISSCHYSWHHYPP